MSDKKKATATNPTTGETLYEHDFLTKEQIEKKIQESLKTFEKYRNSDSKTRSAKLHKVGDYLDANKDRFAKTITEEMGKPIKEAKAEIEKCAKHCRYFADHLEEFQKPDVVPTEAKKSYVVFQPLGPIFHITPFNFPLWLIFKGVVPCLAMGNTVINKNPASCPQCGIITEEAFRAGGFEDGEFVNIIVNQEASESIISNPIIKGVSFTGSTSGGSNIASLAGKYCKKSVMELGGNDPFIVLKDADLDRAVDQGVQSRLRNGGQVCNSAKRFIIDESIYDTFLEKLVNKLKEAKIGNPMEEDTQIGPLAKKDGLKKTIEQVTKSIEQGGKLVYGGKQPEEENLKNGFYYMPTVIEVKHDNILLNEEAFGPIFAVLKFKEEDEAIKIANDTDYGLSGAIFSKDDEKAEKLALKIEAGCVYINSMVNSGSDLPTGGIKDSGFGREGGKYGAHEFVNVKTIWVQKPEK